MQNPFDRLHKAPGLCAKLAIALAAAGYGPRVRGAALGGCIVLATRMRGFQRGIRAALAKVGGHLARLVLRPHLSLIQKLANPARAWTVSQSKKLNLMPPRTPGVASTRL